MLKPEKPLSHARSLRSLTTQRTLRLNHKTEPFLLGKPNFNIF